MKYLLVFILGIFSFFVDAQVTISDDVADYYLELDDKFHILEREIDTKDLVIKYLQKQIITQSLITKTFSSDSSTFRNYLETKNNQLAFKDKELIISKKEIRKQKFEKVVVIVVATAIIVVEVIIPKVKEIK